MAIRDDDFRNFVRGDEKAFEAIFNEYYKTLVSYSMRHGLEQMEAEDVVIEMFHHVWQIRQEIESPAALHTLLYTATRNRSLNVLRNLQNRKRLLEENYRPEEEEEPRDYVAEEEMSRLLDEGGSIDGAVQGGRYGFVEGQEFAGDSGRDGGICQYGKDL